MDAEKRITVRDVVPDFCSEDERRRVADNIARSLHDIFAKYLCQ